MDINEAIKIFRDSENETADRLKKIERVKAISRAVRALLPVAKEVVTKISNEMEFIKSRYN